MILLHLYVIFSMTMIIYDQFHPESNYVSIVLMHINLILLACTSFDNSDLRKFHNQPREANKKWLQYVYYKLSESSFGPAAIFILFTTLMLGLRIGTREQFDLWQTFIVTSALCIIMTCFLNLYLYFTRND